jgi:hypothetical protein
MASIQFEIARLDVALSCPAKLGYSEYAIGVRQLIYECWASILACNLPDSHAVDILRDWENLWHPSIYMTAEERAEFSSDEITDPQPHNAMLLESMDLAELAGYALDLESSREDLDTVVSERVRDDVCEPGGALQSSRVRRPLGKFWLDKEFHRMAGWLVDLCVVDANTREKHWPPPSVKNHDDLVNFSKKKPTTGWLNVGTEEAVLRYYALAIIAQLFYSELNKEPEERSGDYSPSEFLEIWDRLFNNGTFRVGVTHVMPMGVANGANCRDVLYDFDPSAKQFHCFPVQSLPAVRWSFVEGQLDL